jgi:hypothetical protein
MKKNEQEEFLPRWQDNLQPKNKIAENVIAVTLVILLFIFTLGIFTSVQHIGNTIKGRN